ncbi:MAG: hypothetical protein K2Y21_00845 [Phycisphaerales bacterium]|nr:hypothetical protein [Phycisphaerales bacterium]
MLIRVCTILALTAGLASSASAQNALGDGRGLQKNTNKYDASKGPVNKGWDKDAARFRNAIVFGNAPGSSQRSSTLRDSSQFMGSLGSDSLYNFRRDSYYSGLAGQGIRGTEALQYQFALTTGGSTRGSSLTGAGFVARDSGSTGGGVTGFSQSSGIERKPSWLSDSSRPGGTLRSTASYSTSLSLRPSIVGQGLDDSGRSFAVVASPLLGMQPVRREVSSPLNQPVGNQPVGSQQVGAKPEELAAPDPRSAAAGGPESAKAEAAARAAKEVTIYDSLARRLAERGKAMIPETGETAPGSRTATPSGTTPPGNTPSEPGATTPKEAADIGKPKWLRDIEDLKDSLSDRTGGPKSASKTGPTPPGLGKPPAGMRYDMSGKLVPLVDKSVTDLIRDSGEQGARFIKPDAVDASAFIQAMKQGEALMSRNQFFAAEEKFARAMTLRPGDVAAQAARTHAQISGGLFVSAGNNLRDLLSAHPEVAGVRYAKELVSTDERARVIKADLETRMSLNAKALGALGLQPVRDAGLIYAYFSFQLGDRSGVERGIEAMLSRIPDKDEPSLADQQLALFCRGVWLGSTTEPSK